MSDERTSFAYIRKLSNDAENQHFVCRQSVETTRQQAVHTSAFYFFIYIFFFSIKIQSSFCNVFKCSALVRWMPTVFIAICYTDTCDSGMGCTSANRKSTASAFPPPISIQFFDLIKSIKTSLQCTAHHAPLASDSTCMNNNKKIIPLTRTSTSKNFVSSHRWFAVMANNIFIQSNPETNQTNQNWRKNVKSQTQPAI